MKFKSKFAVGVFWGAFEQVVRKFVQLGVTLILAYYLAPEHFGLLAIVSFVLAISSQLAESGLKSALIRMADVSEVDYNTAFFSIVLFSFFVYLCIFIASPWIADFYNQAHLVSLIRVSGLVLLFQSAGVVQVVILSRKLEFKTIASANVPGVMLSGAAAVVLAYFEFGAWALVAQMIVASFITSLLLWSSSDWRPRWGVSYSSLRSMNRFGHKMMISGLLEVVSRNIYVLIIAKLFSAPVVGLYFFSDKIRELIVDQLVAVVQNVAVPALSKIQSDNVLLKSSVRKIVVFGSFVMSPVIVMLSVFSLEVFQAIFSAKWHDAHEYFALMMVSAILTPMQSTQLTVLNVKGRSDLYLKVKLIDKIIQVFIIYWTFQSGVVAMLYGQIFHSIIRNIPGSIFASNEIRYTVMEQMLDFLPPVALGAAASFIALFFVNETDLLGLARLSAAIFLSLGAYIFLCYVFRLEGFGLCLSRLSEGRSR